MIKWGHSRLIDDHFSVYVGIKKVQMFASVRYHYSTFLAFLFRDWIELNIFFLHPTYPRYLFHTMPRIQTFESPQKAHKGP